jgi:hypothetical protein
MLATGRHLVVSDTPPGVIKTRRQSYPCNRPRRPMGLWDIEAPTFSRQSVHRWRWGCQPYALDVLYQQEDSWYSCLWETESTQDNIAARRTRSIKNSNDLMGNRTRDLPQPTTVLRALARRNISRDVAMIWRRQNLRLYDVKRLNDESEMI